jgi:hypothetical protein
MSRPRHCNIRPTRTTSFSTRFMFLFEPGTARGSICCATQHLLLATSSPRPTAPFAKFSSRSASKPFFSPIQPRLVLGDAPTPAAQHFFSSYTGRFESLQAGSRYLQLSLTPAKQREKGEGHIYTIKIQSSAATYRADPAPPAPRRDSSRPMMGAYRTPLLSLHAARVSFPPLPHTRGKARYSGQS